MFTCSLCARKHCGKSPLSKSCNSPTGTRLHSAQSGKAVVHFTLSFFPPQGCNLLPVLLSPDLTLMEESLGFRCFNSPHTHTRSFFSAYFLRGCPFFGTFPTYHEGHLTHAKWNTLSFQRERFSFPLFTQFRLHEFSCFLLKHKYFLPFKLLLDKLGINSVIYKYLGHSPKVACI